ncbi:MAG: hypothetical protein LBF60_03175 [Treponema sp.]|nr:hypothetical protein [Treponema sp.]
MDATNANDEVKAFITGTFIKEQVKFGDTFHLIGFNDAVAVELSRRIMGNDDLNAVIAAVGSLRKTSVASNPAKALDFAAAYIKSLASGRPKKVVLITNAANARNSVSEAAPRFSTIHASLEWMNLLAPPIRPPAATEPPPSAPDPAVKAIEPQPLADTLADTPAPQPARPSAGRGPTAPIAAEPPPSAPDPAVKAIEPQPLADTPAPQPARPSAGRGPTAPAATEPQPPPSAPDPAVKAIEPQPLADTLADTPAPAERKAKIITPESPASSIVQVHPKAVFQMPQLSPAIVTLVSAAFFCMTFAFMFLCRYTLQSLDRTFFLICSQKAVEPAFLSLFVEDQNTNIGWRNMHTISAGWSLTLGGGDSDFLIFLVPIPQNIAKIRFDGDECIFIPQKKQFFPEFNNRMASDCAGKTIKIRSNRNYDLFIRIMRHEAPYKKLCALFQSIKLPAQFSRI